jgi:hypothetical protein
MRPKYLKIVELYNRIVMSEVIKNKKFCSICGKEFEFPYLLERHKNKKKTCMPKCKDYQCQYCNNFFVNKYSLDKHLKICKNKLNNNIPKVNESTNIQTNDNVINLLTVILNKINHQQTATVNNNELQNIKQLLNQNTNSILSNTGQLATTINNNENNMNNSNNNNTTINTTNNTINNTFNIMPNILYPFGFEDINCMTDEEHLELLKVRGNLIPVLRKIYSYRQNFNHIRLNSNKDVITVLDKNMDLAVYKTKEFYEKMALQSITFLKQILHKYQPRLLFEHQLAVAINIEELRNFLATETEFTDIAMFLEARFQNSLTKEIFKKFTDKLIRNDILKRQHITILDKIQNKLLEILSF